MLQTGGTRVLRSDMDLFICTDSGLNFGSACMLKPTAIAKRVRYCCKRHADDMT